MVTAPLHKGVINEAGVPFSGHTEYLAERTQAERAVMMLAAGSLRVALATTHLPLRDISSALTVARSIRSYGCCPSNAAVAGVTTVVTMTKSMGFVEARTLCFRH